MTSPTMRDTEKAEHFPASDDGPGAGVVKSAARALEVLDLFRNERRQLNAAEIGHALGYPKSSTNALLKSLVTLGYLVLDPRSLRYFPSISVTALGDWIPATLLASRDALAVLSEAHAATQETVTLSVLSDLSVSFLKVLPGTFPISLSMTEGFVAPLFTTSVGLAVLSQLDDAEIEALAARSNLRSRRRNERIESEEILRELAEVRERGYAVRYDAVFPDTAAIGFPFPSPMPGFPLALGVGGLRERIRRNEQTIQRAIQGILARHFGRQQRRRPAG